MDALRGKMGLAPDVLRPVDVGGGTGARGAAAEPSGGGKRKTRRAEGHQPRPALSPGRGADAPTRSSSRALNQPGADLLRRVFAALRECATPARRGSLKTLRDDPDFQYLERIVAEPPLGIERTRTPRPRS